MAGVIKDMIKENGVEARISYEFMSSQEKSMYATTRYSEFSIIQEDN